MASGRPQPRNGATAHPSPRPRTTGDASWSFPGSRNSHWPSLAPARDSPGCSVAHDWHAQARCDLAPSTDRPPGAVRPQALATRSTGRHRPGDPPSMAARTALPDELLLGSFTVARARRLSVSRGRLRNPELEAPTRGVRRAATADPEPADHARAFASVLPDDVAFSHVTAARLHALPTPKPWPGADEPLDVMRARHRPPVRREGCRTHRGLESRKVTTVHGLRVTSALDTWCDLAGAWSEADLLALADDLLRRRIADSRGAPGCGGGSCRRAAMRACWCRSPDWPGPGRHLRPRASHAGGSGRGAYRSRSSTWRCTTTSASGWPRSTSGGGPNAWSASTTAMCTAPIDGTGSRTSSVGRRSRMPGGPTST